MLEPVAEVVDGYLVMSGYDLMQLLLNEGWNRHDVMRKTGIPVATVARIANGDVRWCNEDYYRILYNLCYEENLLG